MEPLSVQACPACSSERRAAPAPCVQEAGRLLRLTAKIAQLLFPEVGSPEAGKGAKPVTAPYEVVDPGGRTWQMTYTNRRYSVG